MLPFHLTSQLKLARALFGLSSADFGNEQSRGAGDRENEKDHLRGAASWCHLYYGHLRGDQAGRLLALLPSGQSFLL